MGRYTGPSCRLCRREGDRLYLKGDRCYGQKCAMIKRAFPPGMHGKTMKKSTDYAMRLREKQRVGRFYGIGERQLRKYFNIADKKPGVTGLIFLQMLESRMDNVVYKLGLADSRKEARQKVMHGHFQVNGKKVDLPSYNVKAKDKVTIRENSQKLKFFQVRMEKVKEKTYPAWLNFNPVTKEGLIVSLPAREEIDVPASEQLIVEFYSK